MRQSLKDELWSALRLFLYGNGMMACAFFWFYLPQMIGLKLQ